jgi:hypothetical protein
VHINPEAIRASRRKVWRPLSSFAYPTQQLEHDLHRNYPSHLVSQLHKTFRDVGYTAFSGLLSISDETVMNMEISTITLTTNQAAYVGAIHTLVKQLWDVNLDRRSLQDAVNAELTDLYANWAVTVRLFRDPGPVAYQFIYDRPGVGFFKDLLVVAGFSSFPTTKLPWPRANTPTRLAHDFRTAAAGI